MQVNSGCEKKLHVILQRVKAQEVNISETEEYQCSDAGKKKNEGWNEGKD